MKQYLPAPCWPLRSSRSRSWARSRSRAALKLCFIKLRFQWKTFPLSVRFGPVIYSLVYYFSSLDLVVFIVMAVTLLCFSHKSTVWTDSSSCTHSVSIQYGGSLTFSFLNIYIANHSSSLHLIDSCFDVSFPSQKEKLIHVKIYFPMFYL